MGDFFLLFRTKSISIGKIITETSGTDEDRLKIPEVLCVYETNFSVCLLPQLTKTQIINKAQEELKDFLTPSMTVTYVKECLLTIYTFLN